MSDSETHTDTATRKPRSEGHIDQATRVVVRDGTTYALDDLPQHVVTYLALVGLDYKVRIGKPDVFGKLKGGAIKEKKTPAIHELDPWRLAIAHSIVEQTKRTSSPVLLDAAKIQAAAVTRAKLVELKKHPAVVKQWRKLQGLTDASVLDVLAAPVETSAAEEAAA